jgi:pimeloyl-ACP methyl ester carboxylesterase
VATLVTGISAVPARGDVVRDIVEQRVIFHVLNTNTSDAPCQSDGRPYDIHGLLTAPRVALAAPGPRSISLYLHGFSFGGKYLFSLKGFAGYDWDTELAAMGHTSLVIDRLGYDESDHPNGADTCLGSAADQTHQIVQALRAGTYSIEGGGRVPSFQRVMLVGHDTGGGVAEIEAYSKAFHDPVTGRADVDGLVVWGWAESDYSTWVYQRLPDRTAFCLQGGEAAEDDRPDGPRGYFWWPATDDEVRDAVSKYMAPDVFDTLLRLRNRNPCGDLYSAATTSLYNQASGSLGSISVPVLLIYEDEDVIYDNTAGADQKARFTGSDDVTLVTLQHAQHFPMLEQRRGEYQQLVATWLAGHGV